MSSGQYFELSRISKYLFPGPPLTLLSFLMTRALLLEHDTLRSLSHVCSKGRQRERGIEKVPHVIPFHNNQSSTSKVSSMFFFSAPCSRFLSSPFFLLFIKPSLEPRALLHFPFSCSLPLSQQSPILPHAALLFSSAVNLCVAIYTCTFLKNTKDSLLKAEFSF